MNGLPRRVISTSRRTDIPAFYMPWFMERIKQGTIEVVNPYNRHSKTVSLLPRQTHSIVFWSKNFGPFLDHGYGEKLQKAGFGLFFNFTINSPSDLLEPRVPPLADRLDQLRQLCDAHGAQAINWRFDPICYYQMMSKDQHNRGDFEKIAKVAADCGIRHCVTSFRDDYAKTRKRTALIPGVRFIDPPIEEKTRVLTQMAAYLDVLGIRLSTCCEKAVMDALPPDSGIEPAACVDHRRLARLFGNDVSLKRDSGQRRKMGCGCHVSVDIGDYHQHPCYHNCLFCYANPTSAPIRLSPKPNSGEIS